MKDAARGRRIILIVTLLVDLPILAFLLLALWPFPSDGPPAGVVSNTPGDGGLRRPFPAMAVRPGNPTTPERVALGRLLYFDPVVSGANDLSCATCHHPDLGLTDGRGLSMGRGGKGVGPEREGGTTVKRSAPTVWNAAFNQRQFWDGRARDLEDQARFPITSAAEMDQNPDELVRELRNRVIANNHPNFGDPTAIVSKVPPGAGIFIMAADRTEVAGNEIRGNDSFGIAVVSLAMAFPPGATFDVGPVPEESWIHDNVLAENGKNPAPSVKAVTGGGVDLLWDGSGWTNAWHQPGVTRFPALLPDRSWPDLFRKAWSRAVSGLARMLG